jgi:EAL domain-containing protein (putative c-di-GMP-specific phosphodiesterase class I)
LIGELGAWVLRVACARAARWDGLCLAVNLSPEQVRRPGLVDFVTAVLAKTGLPSSRLELEITEGTLLHETAATLTTLSRLRALGVGIALDDFGTGYSSLSYLRRFPFSKIKIDRSFVAGMATDPGAAAIVQAVATLGRSLDMRVNAEGIETEHQLSMLLAIGCEEAQGYLLGHPCPADTFERLVTLERSGAACATCRTS